MSRATFPPVTPNVKKLFADDYKTWWSKKHGNFLDSYLQTLVDAVGLISTNISEVTPQGCRNVTPKTGNSFASMGGKEYFPLSIVAHDSKNQSSRCESTGSHEDRCCKKVRSSNKSGDADLLVLGIPESVVSPSRTLTIPFKGSLSEVKEEIEKLRQKEKDIEVLFEATEKEIEEAKLGVSTAEKDFDACNNAELLSDDDLTDLV
ncbi:hypothetical protein HAX54_049050 [Datura stramonium]|uniref:Uncharacterized protein n=1 Tax=Datura stramonium TaxID=4076 RepID=A0ABS8WNV4_DATST|nr:hypothetical protein [Datura stramonium]